VRYAIATLSLALFLPIGAHAATRSGLYGTVMRGPITPVCVAEQPCDEPAAGAVLVFSQAGSGIAGRARVKANGSYRITLAAGTYTVRTRSGRRIDPTTVRVRAGRFRNVDFSIDTGIR
jgi:hypothetical protein